MDYFFSITYTNLTAMLLKTAILGMILVTLWYIFFLLLSKMAYRKRRHHKDHLLELSKLWSLSLVMLVVGAYFIILIKKTGFSSIDWSKKETWLGVLPLLALYLLIIIVFLLLHYRYRNKILSTKII
jgi:magnesium-transporting ATPase (P-type)